MSQNKKLFEKLNLENYLTTLNKFPDIQDYQNLGYMLKSLCNLSKSALILSIENPEYSEHNAWDLYNALNLISLLVPEEEFELLDLLTE